METMITYDNKKIEYNKCPGCAYGEHKFTLTSGMIYENDTFTLSQDWELPIPGFLVISPKKHKESLQEFTDYERNELFTIINKTIVILKYNKICDNFNVIFEEKENRHFHVWIMPRYQWMLKISKNITGNIEKIFTYAKENLKTEEIFKQINQISLIVSKELNQSKNN